MEHASSCQTQLGIYGVESLNKLDGLDRLFVAWAFFFQMAFIFHFAIRKPLLECYTISYGWVVYALCIPAIVVSFILLCGGKHWFYWIAGFLFVLFSAVGYWIDYMAKIQFRNPFRPEFAIPYVVLYLSTVMFYWWPLGNIRRSLWFAFAVLFIIGTILNIASH